MLAQCMRAGGAVCGVRAHGRGALRAVPLPHNAHEVWAVPSGSGPGCVRAVVWLCGCLVVCMAARVVVGGCTCMDGRAVVRRRWWRRRCVCVHAHAHHVVKLSAALCECSGVVCPRSGVQAPGTERACRRVPVRHGLEV